MKTTTHYSRLLCLGICLCTSILLSSISASLPYSYHDVFSDDSQGDVAIDMVVVGEFPKYGTSVPFNITVTNEGLNPIFDVSVIDYVPEGYVFDPANTDWTPDPVIPNAYTSTQAGPVNPGESTLFTINLIPIAASDSLSWVNGVEVYEFRDAVGGTVCLDTDSTNDKIQGNEVGDEDDYAENSVALFDLALRKKLLSTAPHEYGDTLVFRTTVFNQANTVADEIVVIDYAPEGYTYDQSLNTAEGWNTVGNSPPFVILSDPLLPGDSVAVEIRLILGMDMADGLAWNNYTEIFSAEDGDNVDRSNFDADSTPNSNSISENNVQPGSPDDDNIDGGGPLANEDEDDHDPAAPQIYDLAYTKIQTTALASFSYDETVTYTNTVFNQGNQVATNVEIVDYIPCGLEFDPNNNPGWSYNSVTRIAHYTYPGDIPVAFPPIESGQRTVPLNLIVVQCYDDPSTAWTNFGEIASVESPGGLPFPDLDSDQDSINNDFGAIPNMPSDNQLDGGGPPAMEDEDDHDVEMIEIVDLAIKKRIFDPGPYDFGDTITFVNTIFNQGNVLLDSIQLRDYLPAGYELVTQDNGDWAVASSGFPETTVPDLLFPTDTINVPFKVVLTPADTEEDFYNYVEIIAVQDTTTGLTRNRFDDADSFVGTNNAQEQSVTPGSPDDDNIFGDGLDPLTNEDNDDHDVAGAIFYDLALTKSINTPTTNLQYGTLIDYTITVTNEGTMPANGIQVSEFVPCGLSFDENDNTGWSIGAISGLPEYTITTTITPGASVNIPFSLTLEPCDNPTTEAYDNRAEISVDDGDDRDSTPDDDPDNDPPSDDDNDTAPLPIYDLSLTKEISSAASTYAIGDPISFDIIVINEGGETQRNIKIVDYLPCGYAFDMNNNMDWSLNVGTGLLEYTYMPDLAPGQSFVTTLNLTLQDCGTGVANDFLNGAEISSSDNTMDESVGDIDSTPDETQGNEIGDEDDYDEAGVDIYDLSLDKSRPNPLTFNPYGSVIQYDITVTNEGSLPASGIEVTDYIPCGLSYDQNDNVLIWNIDPLTGYAYYTIPSTISPGQSVVVSIYLTVEPCDVPTIDSWVNGTEISVDDGDDNDSTPDDDPDNDPPSDDDNDQEPITVNDLALTKSVLGGPSTYQIGDPVTFQITVTNQGNRRATDISVIDYVPCGLSTTGVTNNGWSVVPNSNNLSTVIPSLEPNETVTLTISFIVEDCNDGTGTEYENGSEITEFFEDGSSTPSGDQDSTPDDIPDNDPEIEDDSDTAVIVVQPPATNIGGDVWKDTDNDGIYDTNEEGVPDFVVNLYECNGDLVATTMTGPTGFYVFTDVIEGMYRIEFDLSSIDEPCIFTIPNQGNNDAIDSDALADGFTACIDVVAGVEDFTNDAGLIANLGSIGDYVFLDEDGDGIQDIFEDGISGMDVLLYTESGVLIDMTTTDANGAYEFTGVAQGNYYVLFDADEELEVTLADVGDDILDSDITGANGDFTTDIFFLAGGEFKDDIDAGFYNCATVCGYAWLDLVVENDVRDDLENGLNGMQVTLFRQVNGQYQEYDFTYTGLNPDTPSDDGYFNFCVPSGRYYLKFHLPPLGLVQVLPFRGSDNTKDSDVNNSFGIGTTPSFVIGNGQEKCDIGAGYTPMFEVGNAVWMDENLNGQREAFEAPVEGVLVQAYNMEGDMVGEDVTDAAGVYNIDYLQKVDYYLKFTPSDGSSFTIPLAGNDDTKDSDVDGSYGPNTTRAITGVPGQKNMNIDAGLSAAVLPLEWISIKAGHHGDHNLIQWSTASEINNERFEVERATTANGDYEVIAVIEAQQSTDPIKHYSAKDKELGSHLVYYYRVKQIDVDGRYSYSDIVVIELISHTGVKVYPIPASSHVTMTIPAEMVESNVEITMYDYIGRIVYSNGYNSKSQQMTIDVSHLSSGIYLLEALSDGVVIHQQKIVKE